MVGHEGGRWDVGVKSKTVYVQRVSDSEKPLFADALAPEEARELAGLLTKYADKADESRDSGKSDDSDKSGRSESDESEKSDESDKSDKSDEEESEDSD